eukprot:Seg1077.22 transcript_id=Seg1077.22/GoldUCD/mRNA.D3Y31 product="Polycomb group RING finger protein 1" protein_id=Seg1077.22/GoldUCD/D3Y31
MENPSNLLIKIREINPHIVCSLCAGYFIDATTITECLHTFCKSCIVRYLQTSKYCPTCSTKIHETHPLYNVRLDRTLQEIVESIVTGLREDEENRRAEFYASKGLEQPKNGNEGDSEETANGNRPSQSRNDFSKYKALYRDDEQITLCIEVDSAQENFQNFAVPFLQRKYLRCSVRAKCGHLIKLLQKLIMPPEEFQILIYCNGEIVPKDKTMKFIWLAYWKQQKQPMSLSYKFMKVDVV